MRKLVTPLTIALLLSVGPAMAQAQANGSVNGNGNRPAPLATSTNPHGDLPPGLDCTACHTANGWTPAKRPMDFDHDKVTDFPLTGAHRDVACAQCHLDLEYGEPRIAPTDCAACHADVHEGRILGECVTCHTTTSFHEIAGQDIHLRTGFPLTGAHLQVTCETCHVDASAGAFTALDAQCVSCHEQDYRAATPIDHVAAGFSTDCELCHTTVAFTHSVSFDHVSASGGYPLLGAHAMIRCSSCHDETSQQILFQPAGPEDCISCHTADHQEAHAGAFPTTCTDCHNQNAWEGAEFDHAQVAPQFLLLGAHKDADCTGCHVDGSYALRFTPADANDCFACHQADYQNEHAGSGFPTDCTGCHDVNSWDGAEMLNHDAQFFPIYSGAHRDKWSSCQACHITASAWTDFSCLASCHTQTKTDDQHRERVGYVYESQACYSCHPNGRGD